MNVILLEKIGNLGDIGETADVKAGFARNYLFPQGKAIPATKANLAEFEERKAELLAAHNANIKAAEERKAMVNGLKVTIEVNASDEGKLFGSVGTRDIAEVINGQVGVELQKSEVLLPHGIIRETGEYAIALDLGNDVHAEIGLAIVSQAAPAAVSDDGSVIEEIEAQEAAEEAAEADDSTDAETASEADQNVEAEKPE